MSMEYSNPAVYRILASDDPIAGPKDVATLFGVSIRTAQRWARRGLYGAIPTPDCCAVRFRRDYVVRAYLSGRPTGIESRQ